MKTTRTNLTAIDKLSKNAQSIITKKSEELISKAGAEIRIDSVENEVIQLSVNNINGKRTSKYELLEYTYQLFSERIPDNYRLIVKV